MVVGDFDRPQLHLSARHVVTIPARSANWPRGGRVGRAGIVYAATHAGAAGSARRARLGSERVTLYHAGRPARSAPCDDGRSWTARPHHRGPRSRSAWGSTSGRPLGAALRPAALAHAYYQEIGARRPGRSHRRCCCSIATTTSTRRAGHRQRRPRHGRRAGCGALGCRSAGRAGARSRPAALAASDLGARLAAGRRVRWTER